jgi:uncharacterized membrane protein YfcA
MDAIGWVAVGLAAGTLGSLLGLGGGFLVVPALVLLRGLDARLATGTSVAVIVPTMCVALWRRASLGHVDWNLAWPIALGAVGGAFVGAWLSGRVDEVLLRRLFAVVLVGVAALIAFKK